MRTGQQLPEGKGEGISGEKGEVFVGTIIQDTWTIMGGVMVETGRRWGGLGVRLGWREKAEKCT